MSRTIFIMIIIIIAFNISVNAENIHIHINGQDKSAVLEPISEDEVILVKARSLAEEFNANITWQKSIKTLQFTDQDNGNIIKMMQGSPYIQFNNKTLKSKGVLKLIAGHSYVPLKEISESFGFLYNRNANTIYLTRPESYIQDISWQKEGQQLLIEMDNLSPYRINESDDPRRLVLELENAALADDFRDGLSNKNFYLRVDKVENQARLKITIISQYPIPFQRDRCIAEDGENLVINFLPFITDIEWKNEQLEILTSGEIVKPEASLLLEPRRLVIDIPDVMLSEFNLDLSENDWIKDIRVSQFKNDPIVLRVVLELYPDRYLHLAENTFSEGRVVLQTTRKTTLDDLAFKENTLQFISDNPISPDIFKLDQPDRLVINILNAVRGDGFADQLELDHNIVAGIRTARFNEETVRIVVDMKKDIGFQWEDVVMEDGKIMHSVSFKNYFEEMLISDSNIKTDINLNFTGDVKYEFKKFTYPDRLVVDVHGINLEDGYQIPEPLGVVKSVQVSQFSNKPYITRFTFETNEYNDYKVFSSNPDSLINLSFIKDIDHIQDNSLDKSQNKAKNKKSGVQSDIIVIDAGHGGFDPGAVGPSGLQEKDINLEIALMTGKLLKDAGYSVILTRDDDTFISLKERVRIANQENALLFVSIHNNSSNSNYSEGTETFIAPNKVASSQLLADLLQQELLNGLKRTDRGIKRENFYVIKYTKIPAALVELAFLSNAHEEALLESILFKEKAAKAVSQGIIKYLEKINTGR